MFLVPKTDQAKKERTRMNKKLSSKDVVEHFSRETQKHATHLPNIDFRLLVGTPVFLECLGDSRFVHTVYGERELVEIQILESADILKAGEQYSMWLTQKVIQTKIQKFKPLQGKRLCVVCLGKKEGKRFTYMDYYIGSEEEGRSILKDVRGA